MVLLLTPFMLLTDKFAEYVSHEDSSDSDEYDPPEMDDITEAEDLDKLVD